MTLLLSEALQDGICCLPMNYELQSFLSFSECQIALMESETKKNTKIID